MAAVITGQHGSSELTENQKTDTIDALYTPLNETSREIRILTLLAGRNDDTVECTLETAWLDDPGRYEALSYAWGGWSLPCSIFVDNRDFSITTSLLTALQHLRYPTAARRLWIDAICINQIDKPEQTHQVQLMRDIYQRASRVLVWLGPEEENSDLGMSALAQAAIATEDSPANTTETSEEAFSTLDLTALRAIDSILTRAYWRRAWMRQEIAVPQTDPLIICGYKAISWNSFWLGIDASQAWIYEGEPYGFYITHFNDLALARASFQITDQFSWFDDRFKDGRKTNLYWLLESTKRALSTDPRDRVYSLLGLLKAF